MQRGKLFRDPLSQRARLQYARDFLEWVYAEGRPPEWLQGRFWEWFCGVAPEQTQKQVRQKWAEIIGRTARWHWDALRVNARVSVDAMLSSSGGVEARGLAGVARALGAWTGRDGRRYFHYAPTLPRPLGSDKLMRAALDQFLADLSGLSVDALGQCAECLRWFVRLRGTRRKFCSPRCSWAAYSERQEGAAPGRRKGAPRK